MKIGELARAAQTPVQTVRYYEQAGLLPRAPRSDANYRVYVAEQVQRLALIRHCRSLDMTLDEIRMLLRLQDAPHEDCAEVNALLDDHLAHVQARIVELRQLHRQLKALRGQCVGLRDAAHCGILVGLAQAVQGPAVALPSRAEHVAGAHGGAPRRRAAKTPR